MRTTEKMVTVTIFLVCAFSAHAQGCRVVDPELQGAYSGPCVGGLAEGQGVAEGSARYEGEFKAGMKQGRGVKSWPNGDRYEGEFVADRKQGKGAYTWGRGPWAGERYEGDYLADKRHGYGVYRWASGDVYRGPWENDAFTGEPTEMMRALGQFEREATAAVAKRGQKVCRELAVGIGGRDWLRGEVLEADGLQVSVRIDDPGTSGQARKGEVLRGLATGWLPCL
jgi:hypothetical protein